MKVLVTGAAGFIAAFFVDRHVRDGHDVVGVDNLSNGYRSNFDRKTGGFEFIEGDIRNMNNLYCIGRLERLSHDKTVKAKEMLRCM